MPGFDGLRVPARYAMIAAVFLAIAAGYGVAAARLGGRAAARSLAIGRRVLAFLAEAAFAPMTLNQTWGDGGIASGARRTGGDARPRSIGSSRALPDARGRTEFPFGDPAWELRYVYYSTVHWKRLVNGYSGGFPQGYKVRVARLQRVSPKSRCGVARAASTPARRTSSCTKPRCADDGMQASRTGCDVARRARALQRFDRR